LVILEVISKSKSEDDKMLQLNKELSIRTDLSMMIHSASSFCCSLTWCLWF